ncbi:MAG: MFS transporter [Gaiellaceae bacterium]
MAHWLRDRGFEAYAVRGGVDALEGKPPPLSPEGVPTVQAAGRALGALRDPRFRLYSTGVLISLTAKSVEGAAYGYVVLLVGGSAATLGVIGFLSTIPNLVLALPAGALADRYDQRKLLLAFQGASMLVPVSLAVLSATDSLTVPVMGILAFAGGVLGALSFPAFQGMLASMVPRRDLESAVAINSMSLHAARFVGPAVAGLLLATGGPTWIFVVNAAGFPFVLLALVLLPSRPRGGESVAKLGGAISDGLHYVFGQRSIASLMVLTLLAGLFATPAVAFMLPAIVRFQLDGGGGTLGALTAAMGLGSLLGSLALLILARRPNKGGPLLVGYLATAVAIAALGASSSTPFSLALALVGGFAAVLFIGLSTVVVQSMSSHEMRARAMAIWAAAFVGVLPIGGLVTAALAAWIGSGNAVLVNGLVTLVGGLIIVALRPEIRWLGCAALPEACIAATNPMAIALEPVEARTT